MNESLAPIPYRLLIDQAAQKARLVARALILPTGIPFAAVGVLAALTQWSAIEVMGSGDFQGAQIALMVILLILLVVSSLVLQTMVLCVLTRTAFEALDGRPVAPGAAWRYALRPKVFGTLMLFNLFGIVSLLMCIVPFFYFAPVLGYAFTAMVREDVYGMDAVRAGFRLAHFNPSGSTLRSPWLRSAGLLFVGYVLQQSLSGVVQLPFVVAQQVLMLRHAAAGAGDPLGMTQQVLWLQVPASLLGAIAVAVGWIYLAFGLAMLHREVERDLDGEDLRQAIGEMMGGGAEPRPEGAT